MTKLLLTIYVLPPRLLLHHNVLPVRGAHGLGVLALLPAELGSVLVGQGVQQHLQGTLVVIRSRLERHEKAGAPG